MAEGAQRLIGREKRTRLTALLFLGRGKKQGRGQGRRLPQQCTDSLAQPAQLQDDALAAFVQAEGDPPPLDALRPASGSNKHEMDKSKTRYRGPEVARQQRSLYANGIVPTLGFRSCQRPTATNCV